MIQKPRTSLAVALAIALSAVAATTPAQAQDATAAAQTLQTLTFDVPDMTCATCPITVKLAISAVQGVTEVTVDLDSLSATVTFDPTLTSPAAIAAASENAGYPAEVQL